MINQGLRNVLHGPALALGAALLLPGGASAAAPPVNPSNFLAALKSAHGGDVIRLEPGVYPRPVIANLNFPEAVTITSVDPQKPAVFVGLVVESSSNLTFSGLEFNSAGAQDDYYAFRVGDSNRISFSNLIVHGDRSAEPTTQLSGFYVSKSTYINISESTFDHLKNAMVVNNNDNVIISKNRFLRLDKGGVEMGGCSDVEIASNVFSDFQVSRSTHPDAIQLYTAGTKNIPKNINVHDNLIYRGSGYAVQGIFIQDEVETLPYENLTVSDNAVIGGMWNSIYVYNASGHLKIQNNLVATWPGLDMPGAGTPEALKSKPVVTEFRGWIFIRGKNAGALITQRGNVAQAYMRDGGAEFGAPSGNRLAGDVRDQGKALLQSWLAKHNSLPMPPFQ